VSDRITCPECEGRRGQQLGEMFLACRFCGGLGWVGGSNEPAERGDQPPPAGPPPAWEHKVWTDPAVAAALPCRYCLGAKVVASVNDEAGTLVSAPCPACTPGP
jgi:hypothetical protein